MKLEKEAGFWPTGVLTYNTEEFELYPVMDRVGVIVKDFAIRRVI